MPDLRREVADAYERGWDEALDEALERLRGAGDLLEARRSLEALAARPAPQYTDSPGGGDYG